MANILNVEQYRQKFEPTAHWKMKKEFLEKYQHDFPITRLLCLAQAYVNVELLGCSYPAPLMVQIQELSRSLRRSKNFLSDNSRSDEKVSVFPLIAFRSASIKDKHKAPDLESPVPNKIFKTDELLDLEKTQDAKTGAHTNETPQIKANSTNCSFEVENSPITNLPVKGEIENSSERTKMKKTQYGENYVETNHTIDMGQASYLLDIAYSKDCGAIFGIADAIRTLFGKKKSKIVRKAMNAMTEAATFLSCEHMLQFRFEGRGKDYCEFFIGDTLISSGCGNNENASKSAAIQNSLGIFLDVGELPYKTAENFVSEFIEFQNSDDSLNLPERDVKGQYTGCKYKTRRLTSSDFVSLFSFVQFATVLVNKNYISAQILDICQRQKKLINCQWFFHADWKNRTSKSNIFCHLVINNVLVSSGSGASRKLSKSNATNGFRYLFDLLKYVKHKDLLELQIDLPKEEMEKKKGKKGKKEKKAESRKEKKAKSKFNKSDKSAQEDEANKELLLVDESHKGDPISRNKSTEFVSQKDLDTRNEKESQSVGIGNTDELGNDIDSNEPTAGGEPDSFAVEEIETTPEQPEIINAQNARDSIETNHTIDMSQASYLLDIAYSKDYKTVSDIADGIAKLFSTKRRDEMKKKALNTINRAAKVASCEHLLQFRFEGKNKDYCEFFVGDTLISSGSGKNEQISRKEAVQNGVSIFWDVCDLPYKTAENFIGEFAKFQENGGSTNPLEHSVKKQLTKCESKTRELTSNDFVSMHSFVEFASTHGNKMEPGVQFLETCKTQKKLINCQWFFHADRKNRTSNAKIFCHLVINNVLVSSGSGISMRRSKSNAADGFKYLLDLLKYVKSKNSPCTVQAKLLSDPKKAKKTKMAKRVEKRFRKRIENKQIDEHNKPIGEVLSNLNKSVEDVLCKDLDTRIKAVSQLIRMSNADALDKDRLIRTYQMNFALFDCSEVDRKGHSSVDPRNILGYSASQCQSKMVYKEEMEKPTAPGNSPSWSCSVYINDMLISSGSALDKTEAKLIAVDSAMEKLKALVYTIQEKDYSSVVRYEQIDDSKSFSTCISSSNVGYKLLQKMGWRGGALSVNGITDPITAGKPSFGQGLGFAVKEKKNELFGNKVESFLRNLYNSGTLLELVFATDFSSEEKQVVFGVARKVGLRSASMGRKENKEVFVRCKFKLEELLNRLVSANGITERYEFVTVQ